MNSFFSALESRGGSAPKARIRAVRGCGRVSVPLEKTMEFDAFKLDRRDDGVVTVTLDRPDRLNALTFDTYRQLCDFFAPSNRATRPGWW